MSYRRWMWQPLMDRVVVPLKDLPRSWFNEIQELTADHHEDSTLCLRNSSNCEKLLWFIREAWNSNVQIIKFLFKKLVASCVEKKISKEQWSLRSPKKKICHQERSHKKNLPSYTRLTSLLPSLEDARPLFFFEC